MCYSNHFIMFKSYFISDSEHVESILVSFLKLLNSDQICPLEVAWKLEDVLFIFESFKVIYIFSLPLKFNCATNENEEVIVCLEKSPSFFISISHCKDDYK